MTLARAEMGRKPLDQGLSLRFEKHEVVLQFDMSRLHSQFHQLKSPVNMPFVIWHCSPRHAMSSLDFIRQYDE